jgi:hypothetical protein
LTRPALVALLVMLLLVACSGGGEGGAGAGAAAGRSAPAPPDDGANDRALVLGDSNLFESSGQVEAALRGVGLEPTVRGVPSLGLKDLDAYWLGELPGLLGVDPTVVVVALGTNDTTTRVDVEAFSARLDTMMRAIGDRPVVWVTHVERRPFEIPGGGHSVNQAIRDAATRWPNLTVLDRTELLARNPALLRGDGLHFTDAGMLAFGEEIATAARAALRSAGVAAP